MKLPLETIREKVSPTARMIFRTHGLYSSEELSGLVDPLIEDNIKLAEAVLEMAEALEKYRTLVIAGKYEEPLFRVGKTAEYALARVAAKLSGESK